jgi:hypothetical protein
MPDLSKVRKEFIPASEVPKARARPSQWDEILKQIPRGQALVLHEPEVSVGTVRAAIRGRHRQGRFKNIQLTSRGAKGKTVIYLINTDKPMIKPAGRATQQQSEPTTLE